MRTLLLTTLITLLTAPAAAQEVGGFAEVRGSFYPGVDGTWWQAVERLRPSFDAPLGERVRLVTTLELAFAQGRSTQQEFQDLLDGSDFGPLLEYAGCTWPAHTNKLLRIDETGDYLQVDRLYLDIYLPFVDLRIGRQTLHWGSAQFMNPTDPFPELLLAEPWRPRRGVNALRATFPLPNYADLVVALATNDTFTAPRLAGKLRGRVGGFDLAVTGAWRGDKEGPGDGLVGVDLRGTLGVGLWVEAALHIDEHLWEEVAVGLDYSFAVLDGMILSGQYYRTGASRVRGDARSMGGLGGAVTPPSCPCAEDDAGGSAAALFSGGDAEADPFAPMLSGSDYLLLSINQRFLPELSASVAALQNLGDGSGMLIPTVNASPLGWLTIALSAQIPYALKAGGGEFKPSPDDLTLSADLGPLIGELQADLSDLMPDATITVWTRVNF